MKYIKRVLPYLEFSLKYGQCGHLVEMHQDTAHARSAHARSIMRMRMLDAPAGSPRARERVTTFGDPGDEATGWLCTGVFHRSSASLSERW